MRGLKPKAAAGAFNQIELTVVLVVLALLVSVILPAFVRARHEAHRKSCSNNLKQVGLAFKTVCLDESGAYPPQIPASRGGSLELIRLGHVFAHFRVMSNELVSPKVLVCPVDKAKRAAPDFGPGFSDTNVSYFVGLDASDSEPQVLLSGDRNLQAARRAIDPGLFILTTNTPLGWTKAIHNSCGNVLLSDGSVQFLDSLRLAAAVRNQGRDTNRLAIP